MEDKTQKQINDDNNLPAPTGNEVVTAYDPDNPAASVGIVVSAFPISTATQTALDAKQDTLVSATNIKTVNSESLLGSGDIVITGGGAVDSVNGETGVVVLTTGDIAEDTDANYVSDAEKTVIGNTSGTNTGDQDLSDYETSTELNSRDTNNRARANHTGVQAISTVTGLQTSLDAKLEDITGESIGDLSDVDLTDNANGKILQFNSSTGNFESETLSGGGDMSAATYDPNAIASDAFDMDNMVEGTNLILTGAERTAIAGIPDELTDLDTTVTGAQLDAIKTKTDDITVTGGITGQALIQQPGGGFAPETVASGDNNVTNNYNTQRIDSNLTVGNYTTLVGAVDGSNTSFTVSSGVYASGSLEIEVMGKGWFDFSEDTPASGTININNLESGDWVVVKSLVTETSADSLFLQTEIIVQAASQLSGTLRSDVVYVVDGNIDMGTTSINVPEGGLFIRGSDYFVSSLYSTDNSYTMFQVDSGGAYSGNVKVSMLSMWASGTSSQLFDLDNDGNSSAIEFQSCNIGDFAGATTSLGEIANYRQFRTNDCGLFRVQDGLTFTGTWSGGFRISDTIVLAQAASSTLFKVGAGLTFGGRCISDINAASVDPTTITFDFVASNFLLDGGFQLTGASFAPNSSISVTTDETEVEAFFRDCVEIRNTRPGYDMEFTTQATTALTANTPAKAAGTTTTSNATWFTQTGNNEVTYDSSLTKDYRVKVDVTIDGGANDQINVIVRRYDDSAAAYEDIKTKSRNITNVIGAVDVAIFSFTAIINDLSENDRIEIWIENADDGTDADVVLGSEVFVEAT